MGWFSHHLAALWLWDARHGLLPPLLCLPLGRNTNAKGGGVTCPTWKEVEPYLYPTDDFLYLPGVERSPAEMAQGNVDVSTIFSPYCLNSFTYTGEEFDKLIELTSYNIQNNQHLILQALNSAIEQKRQHKK